MGLQSYKPYSRLVTIISGLIIIIAGLDASQVINIFPQYASQINSILFLAGLIAPAISQEMRVVRAEDLIKEDYEEAESPKKEDEDIKVIINLDGDDIIRKLGEYEDVEIAEEDEESGGA